MFFRLWHQLTLKTLEAVKLPHFSQSGRLKELYDNFLSDFEHRINPLALMEITMYTLRDIPGEFCINVSCLYIVSVGL